MTGRIAAALACAQAEMQHAAMDSSNPHFKSRFASLKSVIDAVKTPLSNFGIAYAQTTFESPNGIGVKTTLFHESGECIESSIVVPADKPTAQGMGSSLTYGRRYALAAICGIAADEDDDGNASVQETEAAAEARREAAERLRAKTTPLVVALQNEDYAAAHEVWDQFDDGQKRFLYNRTPKSCGIFTAEQKQQLRQMDARVRETGSPLEQFDEEESTQSRADNGTGEGQRPEGQEELAMEPGADD